MVVIGQIDALNETHAFVTDVSGKGFRVPLEMIREPMFGSFYQFNGTFVGEDFFEPISVTPLANDSKALLDARAKLWVDKFGESQCTMQKIKETGIDSLVKKVFDSAVKLDSDPIRRREANGTVQIYAEVKPTDRKIYGATVYRSDNLSLVLDSSGFLNKSLEQSEAKPCIRHAPEPKIGVWCSQRKYSIDGIHWKIVRVDPESKPKKLNVNMESTQKKPIIKEEKVVRVDPESKPKKPNVDMESKPKKPNVDMERKPKKPNVDMERKPKEPNVDMERKPKELNVDMESKPKEPNVNMESKQKKPTINEENKLKGISKSAKIEKIPPENDSNSPLSVSGADFGDGPKQLKPKNREKEVEKNSFVPQTESRPQTSSWSSPTSKVDFKARHSLPNDNRKASGSSRFTSSVAHKPTASGGSRFTSSVAHKPTVLSNLQGLVVSVANNLSTMFIYTCKFPSEEFCMTRNAVSIPEGVRHGSWVIFDLKIDSRGEKNIIHCDLDKSPPNWAVTPVRNTVQVELTAFIPKKWRPDIMAPESRIVPTNWLDEMLDYGGLLTEDMADKSVKVLAERNKHPSGKTWHLVKVLGVL